MNEPVTPGDRRYSLPPGRIVRRARDFRLYDQAGTRYVDFWQADGAAFLGHRPRGLARAVAAEIDRGLWAPLPTPWESRLKKALAALARQVGVPALTIGDAAERWRPLDGGDTPPAGEAHVTLPFPLLATWPAFPASPVVLAGLVVAAGLLLRYLGSPEAQARLELAASLPSPPGYDRRGVYWFPRDGSAAAERAELHRSLRESALDRGIILPPGPEEPICCPGELGRRERIRWEELCADRGK